MNGAAFSWMNADSSISFISFHSPPGAIHSIQKSFDWMKAEEGRAAVIWKSLIFNEGGPAEQPTLPSLLINESKDICFIEGREESCCAAPLNEMKFHWFCWNYFYKNLMELLLRLSLLHQASKAGRQLVMGSANANKSISTLQLSFFNKNKRREVKGEEMEWSRSTNT